jgi:hypothetical protein
MSADPTGAGVGAITSRSDPGKPFTVMPHGDEEDAGLQPAETCLAPVLAVPTIGTMSAPGPMENWGNVRSNRRC